MTVAASKLHELRATLLALDRRGGALLVVYPPEEELLFRSGYEEIVREMQARGITIRVLDFRTLVFELLQARGLLDRAFKLEAAGSRDIRQNLAGMVQREAVRCITAASAELPDAILCCIHPASLYPWVSYSALLEEIEGKVKNTLIIPFPGTENGPELHFLNVKDGYNYRAARI